MAMVAKTVDAVIVGDTHLDTHSLEMTAPKGTTIAILTIDNNACGFAEALAWIAEHAPGPRIVVGLEGTRSYGIGLARALVSAGLAVVEVECPRRRHRRRGKSDPIDARLAALEVLRMDDLRKPLPRSDGEREAIRIRHGARCDLTVARTAQINRLRALLLTGDDNDRLVARLTMSEHNLGMIARRRGHSDEPTEAKVRRTEARRLALPIRDSARVLADNKRQLAEMVEAFTPGLQNRLGVGPVGGGQLSCPGHIAVDAAMKQPSQPWPESARCQQAVAAPIGIDSTAAATGISIEHCTTSC